MIGVLGDELNNDNRASSHEYMTSGHLMLQQER